MKQLSLFLFLIVSSSLLSQEKSVGIFGGINSFQFKFSNANSFINIDSIYHPNTGYLFGGHFTKFFSPKIAFRTEFAYQKKGACSTFNFVGVSGQGFGIASFDVFENGGFIGFSEDFTNCDNLHYLEIPMMLQYSFFEKPKLNVSIGQSLGYLFNWEADYFYGEKPFHLNRFDYSWLAGVGISIPLGERLALQINTRVTRGVNDIGNKVKLELRNSGYSATIGIDYKLDQKKMGS